ncbi:MAG: glycosyltransferase family 39 protein, partial [Nitrospirae bacterium]|nr:glycosyltransferase family 39 protein [Nitrospirota bacterium]
MHSNFLKKENIIIFVVIGVGIVLRTVDLGSKSFWTDEFLSIWHARDIISITTFFSSLQGNAHPPLYFLLLKFWSYGGEGETYLRFLSVIFGILTIPMTYLFGRQFFDQKTSLIASFLVAISPFHTLHDREVRMYSMFVLLTIISSYFFIRALREGKTKLWFGYTVFTILNTYTHYHAFLVILSQWLFYIVNFRQYRHLIKNVMISQAVVAFCFIFWIPVFLNHLKDFSALGKGGSRFPAPTGAVLKLIYLIFSFSIGQTVSPWNYIIVIPAAIIFSIAFIFGIKSMFGYRDALLFFSMSLLVPIITGMFITDMFPKYFIFIAPVYSLIIASGIANFPNIHTDKLAQTRIKISPNPSFSKRGIPPFDKGRLGGIFRTEIVFQAIAMVLVIVILGYGLKNYYTNKEFHIMANVDPWREVGNYLKENVKKHDMIFNIGGVPINYYTGFEIPILRDNALQCMKKELEEKGKGSVRIWLIVS